MLHSLPAIAEILGAICGVQRPPYSPKAMVPNLNITTYTISRISSKVHQKQHAINTYKQYRIITQNVQRLRVRKPAVGSKHPT